VGGLSDMFGGNPAAHVWPMAGAVSGLICFPAVKMYRRHQRMKYSSASQKDYRLVELHIEFLLHCWKLRGEP